jgi:hypothetical protein
MSGIVRPILVAGLAIIAIGCSSLGDPIPSYPSRAQSSKEHDEGQCERMASGADVVQRRL